MQALWNDDSASAIAEIARRHGFGDEAGLAMADALAAGGGAMAQFHHPDFGGMGQWSRGGMLMIGDMFNNGLKARVGALADDLAAALAAGAIEIRRAPSGAGAAGFMRWWPDELGEPSSSGAQNGRRYAVFPLARRLAIESGGHVAIYDTADHHIGGASQQQGSSDSLSFSTDRGSIGVSDLRRVDAAAAPNRTASPAPAAEAPVPTAVQPAPRAPSFAAPSRDADPAPPSVRPQPSGDPIELIGKLAALRDAGILSDEEFQAKKTELLARI